MANWNSLKQNQHCALSATTAREEKQRQRQRQAKALQRRGKVVRERRVGRGKGGSALISRIRITGAKVIPTIIWMANISISNYKQLVQTNTTNTMRCGAMWRGRKIKIFAQSGNNRNCATARGNSSGQRQQLCCKLRLSVPKASTTEGPKLAHPLAYCCARATRRMRDFVFIADSIRAEQQRDGAKNNRQGYTLVLDMVSPLPAPPSASPEARN